MRTTIALDDDLLAKAEALTGLRDPDDDMVLECAVAAGCTYIVTHNIKDFRRTEQLGVKAITPGQFLQILRETTT